jgi:hypothetical protein
MAFSNTSYTLFLKRFSHGCFCFFLPVQTNELFSEPITNTRYKEAKKSHQRNQINYILPFTDLDQSCSYITANIRSYNDIWVRFLLTY